MRRELVGTPWKTVRHVFLLQMPWVPWTLGRDAETRDETRLKLHLSIT